MAFITNKKIENVEKQIKLGERISELIGHSANLDMLVGFFFFSGIKTIYDTLKKRSWMKMRVLVGMEAENFMGRLIEDVNRGGDNSAIAVKARFYESMKKIIGSNEVDKQAFHERLSLFIEMLERNRLDIRKTRDPNHAKLYIFTMDEDAKIIREKIWVTGSSNFSEPGLKLRDELNVEISDFGADEAQQYFDKLWERSIPLTDTEEDRITLIKLLRDASVAANVTPYEAYYLVLKQYLEFQKSNLNEERLVRILKEAGFSKYRYQVDAVAQAVQKIEQYRGVIVADVVGLGKSVIAGLIGAMRRRRGLIICPPGLMGDRSGNAGGWYEYIQKFRLKDWQVWSKGKLEDVVEMLTHDSDFDMVVVDEAHNFRNESTADYGYLANICFGREVVLLTATPFNNRPSDLLSLLKLFLPAKSSPLGDLEDQFRLYQKRYNNLARLQRELTKPIVDWEKIRSAMKKCDIPPTLGNVWTDLNAAKKECAKRSKKLANDVRQIMEKVVIRRNRLDLQKDPDYREEITTLSEVKPPKEQFFELSPTQNEFYDRVISDYFGEDGKFHGAIYHPQDYSKEDKEYDDSQQNIYLMLRSLLVQRFESSFGAFKKSVESVLKSMTVALEFINRTGFYLYSRKTMEKLLDIQDDVDLYIAINDFIKELNERTELSGNVARRSARSAEYHSFSLNDRKFDGKRFVKDLKEDIELMKYLLDEIANLNLEEEDPKAQKLVDVIGQILENSHSDIKKENDSPKRKVLVFSSYTDTVEHISKYVEARFPNRTIIVTGNNFGPEKAKQVKRNFDASFEKQVDDYDILVASDKLSEGFNLNRAGVVINYDIPWNPTRVIQRVGRINRIGRKVFEKLYIFNFFPTTRGSQIVPNRQIAESKMFAIHRILGEDAQIFSLDEEPNPSALYDKLSRLDEDETISFYTETKLLYNQEKEFLEKKHPEVLERINNFPSMIKTAWEGDKTQPHATFMFKKFGTTFSVVAHSKIDGEISEWTLAEAISQIKCKYDTPREDFSEEFWQYPNWDKESDSPRGVYEALKQYKPEGVSARGGVPDFVVACNAIKKYRDRLSSDLKFFGDEVVEDIQTFGTIPLRTIKNLAKCDRSDDEGAVVEEISNILEVLRDVRGDYYLEPIRRRAATESILVTIEKH